MKFAKIVFTCFVLLLSFSCITKESITQNNDINFKIGKQGFKKKVGEVFTFNDLTFGAYMVKKNYVSEKGLNLTFKMDSLELISYKKINNYSDKIQKLVKANLLHLTDYDYINITFMQEFEKEGIKKVNSIKVKRVLN